MSAREVGLARHREGAEMKSPKCQDLTRILDDLRRSERLLRASIAEVERLLAEESGTAATTTAVSRTGDAPGLSENAAPYLAGPAGNWTARPDEFKGWSMAEAVMALLQRADGSLSNSAVIESLAAGGFRFRTKRRDVAVAQCLHRLSGQGKVIRLARGIWSVRANTP